MLIEGDVAPNDRDRPARWIAKAAGARAVLPLRPRLGGRRRHGPRPARVARGGAGDELRVARARVSPRARRRPVADVAEATAHAARSDPRHCGRAARRASSRAPARCSRCSPRRSNGCAACASSAADWSLDDLPAHLRMTFSVEDEDGTVLASGQSLDALRDELRPRLKARLEHAVPALARHGMRGFDIASLPRTVDARGRPARLSGARRRGRRSRSPGLRDRGRAGGDDGPRDPAAAAPHRSLAAPLGGRSARNCSSPSRSPPRLTARMDAVIEDATRRGA